MCVVVWSVSSAPAHRSGRCTAAPLSRVHRLAGMPCNVLRKYAHMRIMTMRTGRRWGWEGSGVSSSIHVLLRPHIRFAGCPWAGLCSRPANRTSSSSSITTLFYEFLCSHFTLSLALLLSLSRSPRSGPMPQCAVFCGLRFPVLVRVHVQPLAVCAGALVRRA